MKVTVILKREFEIDETLEELGFNAAGDIKDMDDYDVLYDAAKEITTTLVRVDSIEEESD